MDILMSDKESMECLNRCNDLKFIDIFAGCGGLSLGLMQAGWKGVFAIEHDVNAFQTLHDNLVVEGAKKQFSWPNWLPKKALSVTEVLDKYKDELHHLRGSIDMIVGGPPCQGFSSAGRRDPNDPRNKLVNSYLEYVRIIEPKVVLIENVRGITQDFSESKSESDKINYSKEIIDFLEKDYSVYSKVIDTSLFAVPQKRHRFFIVAIRSDLSNDSDFNFFDRLESDRIPFVSSKGFVSLPISSSDAISDLEISNNNRIPSRDTAGFEDISYSNPITLYQRVMHEGSDNNVSDTRLARHKPEIVSRFEKIINICHATDRLNISLSSTLKKSFGLKKNAIRVLDPNNPSPTITSMPDDLIHYKEPRALTVRENARLQSFPDWFSFKGKYTTGGERRKKEVPRFTQVANAVPPLMAEAIGLTLLEIIASAKNV